MKCGRLVMFLLAIITAMALLSGDALGAAKTKITVAAFHPWLTTDNWKLVVAEFNKTHPDIEVELIYSVEKDHETKVKTLLAGGMPPDLAWSGSVGAEELAQNGALEDFTPYLKRAGLAWPRPQYIDGATAGPHLNDGKIWTVAIEALAYGIFYNKTLFDNAGLKTPARGWDWNQFLESSKKLTIPNERMAIEFINSGTRYQPFIWGSGGRYWDSTGTNLAFRSMEWIRGMQFYIDLRITHKVAGGSFDSQQAAMTGKGNFSIPAPGSNTWSQIDWGFVNVPRGPVQEAAVINNQGYIMFKDSKNKEAAWKFVEWALSPLGQRAWMAYGGRLPVHLPTIQEYGYLHLDPAKRKNVISTIVALSEMIVKDSAATSAIGGATGALSTAMARAWTGEISVQQAVEESWSACVARLEELKAAAGIK